MKKKINVSFASCILAGFFFVAQSQAADNHIKSLTVDSNTHVSGDITAQDGAVVTIGDTDIMNTQAKEVNIEIDNTLNTIKAKDGKVNIGNVQLNDIQGAELVKVKSENHSSGTIEANDGGRVDMGVVSVTGMEGGKVDIYTKNTANGHVEAKNNGVVELGKTTVADATNADITVVADNTVNNVTSDGEGSLVSVGGTELQGIQGGVTKITTTNKIDGSITATEGSKVNIGKTKVH